MMHSGRTTLSKFLIEQLQDQGRGPLAALLVDIAAAIKSIAAMTAKGALGGYWGKVPVSPGDDAQLKLDLLAHEEMLRSCEWGGLVAGMASTKSSQPQAVPPHYRRGPHLLVFDPLGGSSTFDLNVSVGTIFSILPYERDAPPETTDYLLAGHRQLAAGYAIYGPATMLVLTVGKGTHGFTLDREIGNFILTHPDLRICEESAEFAVNSSNERFWEPPIQRYVSECKAGKSGIRGRDFTMRWVASMVADIHRVLMRGGVFLYPHDLKEAHLRRQVRLLHEANPIAFMAEQAGGVASTGRERILDAVPVGMQDRIALIVGSREEVERIERYHREHDEGTDKPYVSPLFNERSLFRDSAA